jgi:nucleoid-associated protein YgaU
VIIQVELDKEKQLGVNFAVVDNLGQQLGTIGSGFEINNNVEFNSAHVLTSACKIAAGTATAGAAGAASAVLDPNGFTSDTNGIKYGFISNNVTEFVRAVESLGSTKVLASPRILVLNKQRAEIQLGSPTRLQIHHNTEHHRNHAGHSISQRRKSGSRPVDDSVVPASAQVVASKEKPTPATHAAVTQALQYHVLPGDSFESIAKKFYGSKHYASLLWWANRRSVAWPEALKPGCIVIVPPLQQMAAARLARSPSRSQTATPAPMPMATGPPAPFPIAVPFARGATELRSFSDPRVERVGLTSPPVRARNAPSEFREGQLNADDQLSNSAAEGGGYSVHIVRKDETLHSIAAQRLGDVRRSHEIADLNRDLLGKDARLTPGERLLLPDDAFPPRPGP